MRRLLLVGGWLYVLAIVWLSLAPDLPDARLGLEYGDKLQHFVAYAGLMLWFAWLYRGPPARAAYALLWIAMGVGLEFVQAKTGYRSFELADMAANALGVAAGAAAALILPRPSGAGGTGTR